MIKNKTKVRRVKKKVNNLKSTCLPALTGDGCGGSKGSCNLRVHLNVEVLLSEDLGITCLDAGVNPLVEGLTHEGVDDVGDVLPRKLVDLMFNWQRIHDIGVVVTKLKQVLDPETFKVGH